MTRRTGGCCNRCSRKEKEGLKEGLEKDKSKEDLQKEDLEKDKLKEDSLYKRRTVHEQSWGGGGASSR